MIIKWVKGRFNAARGFEGGAAQVLENTSPNDVKFQCRTRLCGWCSNLMKFFVEEVNKFQCRTRLCGWCSVKNTTPTEEDFCFNAARGFVDGAARRSQLLSP